MDISLVDCLFSCCGFSRKSNIQNLQINRDYFWTNLLYNEEKTSTFKQFIREKKFVLREDNTKNDPAFLTIGLDPENQFNVFASLKVFRSGCIILDADELKLLFERVNHFQKLKFEYEELDEVIDCISFEEYKLYMFKVYGRTIGIDEKSSEVLHRMEAHIIRYIAMLEDQVIWCEKAFFKLLEHFYHRNTIQNSLDLSQNNKYLQDFFNKIIEAKCVTIDQDFVLDIATKFEKFFVKSLPIFIRTLMLKESERIHTFNIENWPHHRDHVSIKKMAISGLYFTGSEDKVKCAFCPVVIYKWVCNDDPIADHHKFSKHCRFLWDPKHTWNVLDISSESELRTLLSHLPERGIDEVDRFIKIV